jgi:predicted Zn-dependent peptidase
MSDLNRITRADCEQYFKSYYAPNNCALWLAGDFEPDAALAEIERRYGPIPAGPPTPLVPVGEPAQKGERRSVIRFPAQTPSLLVGYRAPAGESPESLAVDLLEVALGHGEGARLRRALVYGQELCSELRVGYGWRLDPGLFQVGMRLNPGVEPAQAEAALWAELERVRAAPLTELELVRAKNLVRSNLLRSLVTNNGRAHLFGELELMLGDWRALFALPDRYEAITAEQVRAAAERLLAPHRRNLVTLLPGDQPETDPADLEPPIDAFEDEAADEEVAA